MADDMIKTGKAPLTPKQQRLVVEYLKDANATRAAIEAGYSAHTANRRGYELLRTPCVKDAIEALESERLSQARIDADELHGLLTDFLRADISQITDSQGRFIPLPQWPSTWRRLLTGIEVEEIYGRGDGTQFQATGRVIRARFIDRTKLLELAGKLGRVSAFEPEAAKEPKQIIVRWQTDSDEQDEIAKAS